MSTGGTIPSNRTQSVTFYNTTGVIEKEKLIYLAPRFSTMNNVVGKEVRKAFIQALEGVCPPSSVYSDISISGWSPQDRTLSVRGNIDDFRLVTEEGDCLNYFIVKRTVTKKVSNVDVAKEYYYGFFITGVEQLGGSSVLLQAEPDDFTNVFYLHNIHVLTALEGDYEPFNERMKNCHINRQHYNRVQISEHYYTLDIVLERVQNGVVGDVGDSITINFADGSAGTEVIGTILVYDDSHYDTEHQLSLRIKSSQRVDIGEPENWSTLIINGNEYDCDYIYSSIDWNEVTNLGLDNIKLFLNQEESFKFKYQYRDLKYPVCKIDNVNFTVSEMQSVEETATFSSLPSSLQRKILKTCLSYVVLQTKSREGLPEFQVLFSGGTSATLYPQLGNHIAGVTTPSYFLACPIMVVPLVFEKYSSAIKAYPIRYRLTFIDTAYQIVNPEFTVSKGDDILEWINQNAMANYVYSVYLVNDIGLKNSNIEFNSGYLEICLDLTLENSKNDGFYYMPYRKDMNEPSGTFGRVRISIDESTHTITSFTQDNLIPMIAIQSSGLNKINLTFSEKLPADLKTSFYDQVLEAEPYSFYSVSIYSSELVFDKNRYLTGLTNTIELNYTINFNGGVKMIYTPVYEIEGYKTQYYNEAITMTVVSQFPIMSSSYDTYYYENMSQMKNQFAVNNFNRGIDLLQHFAISGPNAVGYSAGMGGAKAGGAGAGFGALLETGNQFMQMADEAVDWWQSNKVIEMNQKAKLADVGRKPDNLKQSGSDVYTDLETKEFNLYVNHYTIDQVSYNSIAKFLERFGYQTNLYGSLNVVDRVGWNFVKLNSFDWSVEYDIMTEQESSLRKIFLQGVTLLHDKNYLTSGHNYETILDD